MEPGPVHRLWRSLRTRPALLATLVVAGAGVIAFVAIWFQPQTLLFDTVVEEDFPVAAVQDNEPVDGQAGAEQAAPEQAAPEQAAPEQAGAEQAAPAGEEPDPPAAPTEPLLLGSGDFTSRSRYSVEGVASTYALADGARILRLEGFRSTNGPDLLVYLTSADAAQGDDELAVDFVDLGLLTGNVGDQNYVVPRDVDLGVYDTVVIWCRRFTVAFGAADLVPAA